MPAECPIDLNHALGYTANKQEHCGTEPTPIYAEHEDASNGTGVMKLRKHLGSIEL